jgi:hypothetical protein
MTVRDGKIVEVEVYFGWSIPHEAPEGGWAAASGVGNQETGTSNLIS